MRPLASDASLGGVGFASPAIESIVSGKKLYETTQSGIAAPIIGTDPCGFPRGGMLSRRAVSVIVAISHGSIFGCRVKLVNQSQAPRATGTRARAPRRAIRSAFTAHLHRPMLAEHRLD